MNEEAFLAQWSQGALQLVMEEEQEGILARKLIHFGLILESVLEDHRPNFLCNYLYELAGCYTAFYEHCPVLKSEGQLRASRLLLCLLTRRVLNKGLELLGIETPDSM